jgi:radical SAM superfamily enzyme YgiQ (UPF0313 family)
MKVLLVALQSDPQSVSLDNLYSLEPLALEYIAAGLKGGHDVKLLDMRVETEKSFRDVCESYQPHVVACGALTPEVYPAKRLFQEVKSISPDILTVIGGHHATVKPEDFFDPSVDVIVAGEGVDTFRAVCESMERQKSFEDIKNIHFRRNGSMEFTGEEDYPPLDNLPLPERGITADIRHRYQNYLLFRSATTASMRSSVGCLFKCKFCAVSSLRHQKVFKHNLDRVLQELGSLKEDAVAWLDDELLIDPERAHTLAKRINENGIKKVHAFFGRSDSIINNPECIEEWAKAGLKYVMVGFESHREADLQKIMKASSLSKNEEAIRILHANGVKVRGSFIVQQDFMPEDFNRLAEYVWGLKVDIPTFSVMTPYPGTQLYKETVDQMITDNYSFFDMVHTTLPTTLPLKKFYKEYSELLFKKSLPVKEKIKFLKEMRPGERWQYMKIGMKLFKRVKNAHRYYN